VKLLQASVGGNWFSALNSVKIGAETFVLNGATYNAKEGDWTGEWFMISRDATGIATDVNNYDPGMSPAIGPFVTRQTGGIVELVAREVGRQLQRAETTVEEAIAAGDVLGTLTIMPPGHSRMRAGDVLTIFDNVTGVTQNIVLEADVDASDTSITFTSLLFASSFGLGSYLIQSRYNPFADTVRVDEGLSVGGVVSFSGLADTDPGIPGQVWNDEGVLKISL